MGFIAMENPPFGNIFFGTVSKFGTVFWNHLGFITMKKHHLRENIFWFTFSKHRTCKSKDSNGI